MNRKPIRPRHDSGEDPRPLVLLTLGLLICLAGILRFNPRLLWDHEVPDPCKGGDYVWLTAPEHDNTGVAYCLPVNIDSAVLYAALGLDPPQGPSAFLHPPPLSTILMRGGEAPVISSDPNPRLASFFFLPVPINRAGRAALMTVPGIGPGLADRIIRSREKEGCFHNSEELLRVNGLGKVKIGRFAELFSFAEP